MGPEIINQGIKKTVIPPLGAYLHSFYDFFFTFSVLLESHSGASFLHVHESTHRHTHTHTSER